ncbi:hypothetical protein SAMN05446037_1001229 [Anaerovirgula multivorans]|uniref:Polymerase/histidinol phosphatase N-terminal domain-containing protein n=1 Tax=Anaerovirgula multivorans TaxID=312168 RepID=A0A239A114_9FIRM|nr:PHP domain-containing protein [Anaerovirgula multivorans]SNR88593.1 hypothetical protein SAMN05446037_1001229 [Anaerovirgula multivorans]
MKYIDMHVHTTASDGILTPRQLIDYGLQKGLSGMAITDHDTVNGIHEAVNYSKRYCEFSIIAGIELSTELLNEEVHILGYDINYNENELLDVLKLIQNQRVNRAIKIVEKLQDLKASITYKEILQISKEGVVGRPHIAKVLMEKGYVKTVEEAFENYLNKGCPAYVPRYKLTPFEAIDLIHRVKGLAVLAHPGLIKNKKILIDIIKRGIDGIEAYHPEHKEEDRKRFLSIAQEHNLIITGGSDFHSPPIDDDRHGDLGSEKVLKEYISRFIKGLER